MANNIRTVLYFQKTKNKDLLLAMCDVRTKVDTMIPRCCSVTNNTNIIIMLRFMDDASLQPSVCVDVFPTPRRMLLPPHGHGRAFLVIDYERCSTSP